MSSVFAIALAGRGLLIGVVHSLFAKPYGIGALYPENKEKRRITGLIWHLPSITWVALSLAILAARLLGVFNPSPDKLSDFCIGRFE
jgi:hypothetical protein